MRVSNLAAYLIVTLSAISTIVPSAYARKTYRTLEHHVSKESKKSGSSEENYPPFSMSMEIPDISLDMSIDMSYPSGKGKGKGKGSKKESDKSGKGASHGKGDKKGSKSEKKSKGKGKGSGNADNPSGKGGTEHPAPSPSSADETGRPPSPIPPTPATSPSPAPPSGEPLQEVKLPRYEIAYILGDESMPSTEDYLEVAALTDTFFSDYMFGVFDEPTGNSLVRFQTSLHTAEFRSDEATLVYDSTAYFAADVPESRLPSPESLETLLQLSLDDPSDYLALLMELGPENPFSNTMSVGFDNGTPLGTSPPPTTKSGKSGASSAAIAAGAVGATLLVAGMVLYRRRNAESDEDYYMQKNLNSKNRDGGGATVAGETYAGETFDGTASVSPSSHLSGDEEHGMVQVDLDEPSYTMDTSSVSPSLEGLSTAPALNDDESESDSEGDLSQGSNEDGDDDFSTASGNKIDNARAHTGSDSISRDENDQDHTKLDKRAKEGSIETPSLQLSGSSQEETSVTTDQEEFVAPTYATKSLAAFDAYLESSNGSMSIDSKENDHESDDAQSMRRRPLSVAEIEAMLNTNY